MSSVCAMQAKADDVSTESLSQFACTVQLKNQNGVSRTTVRVSKSQLDFGQRWSTAVFIGQDPEIFTVGLSATLDLPDVLEAEVATGKQPDMAMGPGHAAAGTLIETTRVHLQGNLTIIFDLPTLGIEVVCDPFAP
jgi:hypothetical protein